MKSTHAFRSFLAAGTVLGTFGQLHAQSTRLWTNNSASTGVGWHTTSNWSNSVFAGEAPAATLTGEGLSTDIMGFATANTGTVGAINMTTFAAAGGVGLSLGGINLDRNSTNAFLIGNSSTTVNGIVQLNGATINSVANTLIRAHSGNFSVVNASTNVTNAGQTLGLQLGITNGVFASSANRTLTIRSNITEANAGSGFTKSGAGTLSLYGTNSYTGQTVVGADNADGGVVNVYGDHSAANGGWVIRGDSTVNFQSGSTVAVAAGKTITLNNSAGAHSLNAFGTVTSAGSLVVRGRSTLNLESGADWTQNGSLTVQPQSTSFGATMNVKTGSTFTYGGASNIIVAKSNSSANPGSASVNLNGGTFITGKGFDNTAVTATTTGTTRLTFSNGGTLRLSADIASLIIQGTTEFGVVSNTGGGVIDTNNFTTGIAVEVSGTGGLTKAGAGTLTLSGNNTYAGNTTVTGGILNLASSLALQNSTYNTAGSIAGDPSNGLRTTATTLTLGGLTGNKNLAAAGGVFTTTSGGYDAVTALTLNPGTGASLIYSGSIEDGATGMTVTKTGAGTQALAGTNTYSGATTVSAGTLYVTGALSNSAVTVEASGTIGRNGATNGGLGNGLTIAAGGKLDLTGATLGTSSTGILGITGGSLTLGNLTFQDLVGWDWLNAEEGTYELIDGAFSVDFGSTAFLSSETAYYFGNGKKGYFTAGSLNVVIIPEPSAALLGGLGLLTLLRRRRAA